MLRVLSFSALLASFFILFFPTYQWASHDSVAKENLFYITKHIFKEVGGFDTFRFILGLKETAQTDKDLDLIFKAAGINKEEALTAFKCFGIATDLISAGIKPNIAIRITKEIEKDQINRSSAVSVLTHALKEEGALVDSTQVAEALRQAEMLLHMELNPKVAFEENGIDIDLIDLVQRKVKAIQSRKRLTGQGNKKLKEEDLLPREKK